MVVVKISSITIFDTGYPNTINDGTRESATNRANSGTAIVLQAVEASYERRAGYDNTPAIGRFYNDFTTQLSPAPLSFASVEAPKIRITGTLSRTVTADMDMIKELDKLCTTRGIKLLYYNSTTDGYRDLTDSLGDTDTYHTSLLGSAIPHLHVRFNNFSIRHTSDKLLLRFELTCEVMAPTPAPA